MANTRIKTKGMHCYSCEQLLKQSLGEIQGVNKVSASYESGEVFVGFDKDKITEEDLMELIKMQGYELL